MRDSIAFSTVLCCFFALACSTGVHSSEPRDAGGPEGRPDGDIGSSPAGSAGSDGGAGVVSTADSGGSVGTGDCSQPAPAAGGELVHAFGPASVGIGNGHSVDVVCDGSFVALGFSLEPPTFDAVGGTVLQLPASSYWIGSFDRSGLARWVKPMSVAHEALGSFYVESTGDGGAVVAGVFETSATFAPGEANETTLSEAPDDPIAFIARYASDGSLLWVRRVSEANSSYVAGLAYRDGMTFTIVAVGPNLEMTLAPGELDLFIPKDSGALVALDANGRFVRASPFAPVPPDYPRIVALDDGGVLVTGNQNRGALLAKGTPEETVLPDGDIFLARYDAELKLESVRPLAVPSVPTFSAAAPDGSLVVAGRFDRALTLGAGEAHETSFRQPAGEGDVFVARYGPDGKLAWAKPIQTTQTAYVFAVSMLPDGTSWLALVHDVKQTESAELTVATGEPGQLQLSADRSMMLVLRMDPDGTPEWLVPFTGTSSLFPNGIDAAGDRAVVTGLFEGLASFGSHQLSAAYQSAFVLVLGP